MNYVANITIPIQVKASLALLSAQLCLSGWHVIGSVAFRGGTDPVVFVFYRMFIGTFLMHLFVRYCKMSTVIDPSDYRRMFSAGILSFLNVICGSCALKYIAPSRFAIFQPCIPFIVMGISMAFKLEQVHRVKLIGIALAVTGAFVAELWTTGGDDNAEEANVPLGVFLAIAQVFAMGSLMVVVKPLLGKYDPAVVSAMYFLVSCGAIVVVVLCRIDIIPTAAFAFNNEAMAWLALLYVAIFATMYSFTAVNWGGKYLPPTVTTVFFTFQPVGTIILSAMLLGARVTAPQVVGGLLIVTGLVVTSLAQSQASASTSDAVQTSQVESSAKSSTEDLIEVTNVLHTSEQELTEIEYLPIEASASSIAYNPLQSLRSRTSSASSRGSGRGNAGCGNCNSNGGGRSPRADESVAPSEVGGAGTGLVDPEAGGSPRAKGSKPHGGGCNSMEPDVCMLNV